MWCVRETQRRGHNDGGALLWRALDLERAPHECRAFSHAHETEASVGPATSNALQIDALAVVMHGEDHAPVDMLE